MLEVRAPIHTLRQVLSGKATRQASWRDLRFPEDSATADRRLESTIQWLIRAHNATGRNGVSYGFDLNRGWLPAYPETTGYIIPTLLKYAERIKLSSPDWSLEIRDHARQMANWLTTVQMECGAMPGGTIDLTPAPTIFNTGQILQGWCHAYREFKDENIKDSLIRAARWLVSVQDDDGCWRKFMSPRTIVQTPATYNVRSASALLEASDLFDESAFRNAAIKNFDWALRQQTDNGWFNNNCLTDITKPLTHTIGYTLEGLIDAALRLKDERYLASVVKASKSFKHAIKNNGFLSGRLDSNWQPQVNWACLTGSCQIALVWYQLSDAINDKEYSRLADRLLSFVKRTQQLSSGSETTTSDNMNNDGITGGIKGSHPIWGGYDPFRYLNWAAKFFADALLAGEEHR